jgi:hypothetical protein
MSGARMEIPKHPTLLRRLRDARVKELQARGQLLGPAA